MVQAVWATILPVSYTHLEVKKEFEKEDELAEKSKRLEELNVLLNEDNKKNDTQEVSTEKIEKKNQEWER